METIDLFAGVGGIRLGFKNKSATVTSDSMETASIKLTTKHKKVFKIK